MIKNQSQCPYCNACVVAYDWDADKIIFNPDLAKPYPCEHVAFVGVYCLTLGQMLAHRHTVWLHSEADQSIAEYLRGIGRSRIIHADRFEWLGKIRENSFHAIVTDPSYWVKE